jgi:carbon storage regulator CsrA
MLVLTRRAEQSVVVGSADGIECMMKVTVLAIRSGSVQLGFEVANRFPVHRWEVWERIKSEEESARTASSSAVPAA